MVTKGGEVAQWCEKFVEMRRDDLGKERTGGGFLIKLTLYTLQETA